MLEVVSPRKWQSLMGSIAKEKVEKKLLKKNRKKKSAMGARQELNKGRNDSRKKKRRAVK